MKPFLSFIGIAFYTGAALDNSIGSLVYVFWIVAFVFLWSGWSLLITILFLISSVSYKFMSINSQVPFESEILPWVFGISSVILMLFVISRIALAGGHSGDYSDGGFGNGGGDGAGD